MNDKDFFEIAEKEEQEKQVDDDIRTHHFIDNKEKIAKKYQKKYCNFLTVREIIKYKYNELVRFFNREY